MKIIKEEKKRTDKNYFNIGKIVKSYWVIYGGVESILTSPYFHASLIICALTWHTWTAPEWWSKPLSILPNLVGFTLGGYAMLMAFGDEKFRQVLLGSKSITEPSPFMAINGTFVHFIVMQIFAIVTALIAEAQPEKLIPNNWLLFISENYSFVSGFLHIIKHLFWFFGYLVFIYAITLTVAATFGIFRIAGWYDKYKPFKKNDINN